MRDEKHEGIVLRSLDFKDREKIITLFTPTKGLISLIVKGITKKKSHLLTLTSPFTRAEYHFQIGKTDLFRFRDGTPIDTHHSLRKSLSHIQAATTIAKSLLISQLPEKKSPNLYKLTLTYLSYLSSFEDPAPLATSFLLKLLLHDGHLSLASTCSLCPHSPTHLHEGEPYCTTHAPAHIHPFSKEEWYALILLTTTRTIGPLKEVLVTDEFHQKVMKIFYEKI